MDERSKAIFDKNLDMLRSPDFKKAGSLNTTFGGVTPIYGTVNDEGEIVEFYERTTNASELEEGSYLFALLRKDRAAADEPMFDLRADNVPKAALEVLKASVDEFQRI